MPTVPATTERLKLDPSDFKAFATKDRLCPMAQGVIWGLCHAGVSQNEIQEALQVHSTTVCTALKAVDAMLAAAEDALPTVPPQRATTPEPTLPEEPPTVKSRRDVVLDIAEDLGKDRISSLAVRAELKERTGLVVSASSVRRDLHECGYAFKARDVTTALNADRMVKRVAALDALEADFKRKKMIFTDESMFRAVDMKSKGQWVADGDVPTPVRKDRWSAQVHVWGAICEDFRMMVRLDGYVDAILYKRVLITLVAKLREKGNVEDYILMQDGASPHRAASTMAYLAEVGLEVVTWPPYSPDLNPIENLWGIVKQKLDIDCFTKKPEVLKAINATWEALEWSYIENLLASFPGRLDSCRQSAGDDIKLTRKRLQF